MQNPMASKPVARPIFLGGGGESAPPPMDDLFRASVLYIQIPGWFMFCQNTAPLSVQT